MQKHICLNIGKNCNNKPKIFNIVHRTFHTKKPFSPIKPPYTTLDFSPKSDILQHPHYTVNPRLMGWCKIYCAQFFCHLKTVVLGDCVFLKNVFVCYKIQNNAHYFSAPKCKFLAIKIILIFPKLVTISGGRRGGCDLGIISKKQKLSKYYLFCPSC